jgi:hypothetical protein
MTPLLPLDERDIRRFSRQILLREVGGRGQLALRAARECVPPGPAGDVCARYLFAAGVGTVNRAPIGTSVTVAAARDASDAWLAGAFAAVEAQKRILGVGTPAPSSRLELTR